MYSKLIDLQEVAQKASFESRKKSVKLSARQRLNFLFDENTFQEIDALVTHRVFDFGMDKKRIPGDGVITGFGDIQGRTVYAFAQDSTCMGGSLGESHAEKICKVMELAAKTGSPFIAINDSGGARIQEGVMSLAGYGNIFYRNTKYSGIIPQITLIMGPCAGGAVYSPALMDFIIMVRKQSYMFVTGPKVVKAVTHEDISSEELGGGDVHSKKSGVAHFVVNNDLEGIHLARKLLSYLPSNNMEQPPYIPSDDDPYRETKSLETIVPKDGHKSYDVRYVIEEVCDKGSFLEIHKDYATNIVVGFARLDGRVVGVLANQPCQLAGALDINASRKGARFIMTCNTFNIPLLTFVDVPGFLPGKDQEHGGIISNGAKLLHAYCKSTVPKISVILRKAYGGAYIVMSSKHIGGDINLAWPTAEIAVMGAAGAVEIIYKKEISESPTPELTYKCRVKEYEDKFSTPRIAAERGYIDAIIQPYETRAKIIAFLKGIIKRREMEQIRKNANIPL